MTVHVHSEAVPSGAIAVRLTAAEAEVMMDHLTIAAARAFLSGDPDARHLDAIIRKLSSLGDVAGLTVYAVARPEAR